jgi:SagB-type dehydrogenase family enzyme
VAAGRCVALSGLRLRRSATLVVTFEPEFPVVFNFLHQRRFGTNAAGIEALGAGSEWEPPETYLRLLANSTRDPAPVLASLVAECALVVEGSPAAALDERFRTEWEWGTLAGLYHFGVRDQRFADEAETRQLLTQRLDSRASPDLTPRGTDGIALPGVSLDRETFATMWRRRTQRAFADRPLSLTDLSDLLYFGFAITGMVRDELLGDLPLKAAPSGGARNPFDGYVYCRHVDSIEPGVYRYSALDKTLSLVASAPLPPSSALLAGQPWADGAAAVIFLVANYPRTMWKYVHPISYRVVLIEAGHIVQNILLAGTERDLAMAPTSAIADTAVHGLLGLDDITQGVPYAVAAGPAVQPNGDSLSEAAASEHGPRQ